MATKILYLGAGKWCYTKTCVLHAREISLVLKYKEAVKAGDSQRIAVYSRELMRTPVGLETYRHLKVKELKKVLGRSPTIGLDLDNTTGDFTDAFRSFMGTKYKIKKKDWLAKFPEPSDYSFIKGENSWFEHRDDLTSHLHEAEKKGLYLTLKPFPNAQETLQELKDYGFKIKVVTARNVENSVNTRKWLEHNRIPFTELVALGHHHKASVEGVDVYVDDAPNVIEHLSEHKHAAILMNKSYNVDHVLPDRSKVERVEGWGDEVVDAVFGLLSHAKNKAKKKN